MKKLTQGEGNELRAKVWSILRRVMPIPNVSREDSLVLKDLKEDKPRMILSPYKGAALVVLDNSRPARSYQQTPETLQNIKAETSDIRCTLLLQDSPNHMGYPRSIKQEYI